MKPRAFVNQGRVPQKPPGQLFGGPARCALRAWWLAIVPLVLLASGCQRPPASAGPPPPVAGPGGRVPGLAPVAPSLAGVARELLKRTPLGSSVSEVVAGLRTMHAGPAELEVENCSLAEANVLLKPPAEVRGRRGVVYGEYSRALLRPRFRTSGRARHGGGSFQLRYIYTRVQAYRWHGFRAGLYATYFFDRSNHLVYFYIVSDVDAL